MKNLFLLLFIGLFYTNIAKAQFQSWFEPSLVTRNGVTYIQKVGFYAFGGSKIISGGGGLVPDVPTLITPANSSTDIDPAFPYFDWSNVATATSYSLLVDDNSDYSSPFVNVNLVGVSEYNYDGDPFICGTVYYWKVRATNSYGSSAYSSSFTYSTVPIFTPTLLTPTNHATNVDLFANITFSWTPSNNGGASNIQVSDESDFEAPVYDEPLNGGSATFELSGGAFNPSTTYYWRVRHYTDACGYGSWSNTFSYTMAEF